MGYICNTKNPLCCNQKNDIITLDLNLNISLNSKNINLSSNQGNNQNNKLNDNSNAQANIINQNTTNNNINLNVDQANKEFLATAISQKLKNATSSSNNKANLNFNIKGKRLSDKNFLNNQNINANNNLNNINTGITNNNSNINGNNFNSNTFTNITNREEHETKQTYLEKNFTKKNSFFFDKSNFINMKKRNIFDEYEIVRKLGEGAFGCVYKLLHKKTGFNRAVKVIKKQNIDNDFLLNEIVVLKSIDHPNVIKTFECYFDSNHYYMIQEYCSGGDLYDYIKKQKFFTEKKAACIMYQLLSSINHLHSKKIVHRDLKPENIVFVNLDLQKKNTSNSNNITSSNTMKNTYLLSINDYKISDNNKNNLVQNELICSKNPQGSNGNCDSANEIFIKVIDFGTSIFINNQPLTQELGTIYYIAPEVFKNNYNEKCDLWSCGIILYTMLCGHPPFRGKKEEEIRSKIIKGEGNISSIFQGNEWKKVSKEAIDFVCELLEYNIEKRLSAEQALDNKWLKCLIIADENNVNILDDNIMTNLIRFHSSITLQKASLAFIAIQTGESEDISRIKKEFDKIDINRDGVITKNELVECKINIFFIKFFLNLIILNTFECKNFKYFF